MRLLKPTWVSHDDSPIFSVDIHPDGKRFATGGQGGDSGRVVIWSIDPVLEESVELDENAPKMLCQLDHHLACVNCVRWSSNGLLASGGDDKLIMIWRLVVGVGGTSIFGNKTGVETWRCITTLRAHAGDILDLAWAPHNPWLASASVDNTVIIWDTTRSTILSILRGHSGLVKGVAWDPIGNFVASQSDDKTLRVWKTKDWSEEALITEPFEECGNTTHILRLSWSPDGQYLVSAHAMNGGGPTAQIIERDGWKQDKDFVGHRKAVTCVRFNGNILQKKSPENKELFCCAAIGSRDRSLSIWKTNLKRPLVVIHELFTHSVLDISWSPCGMKLCACSKDGTVIFIEFSEKELGSPLNISEKTSLQEKLYGKLFSKNETQVIESVDIFAKNKNKQNVNDNESNKTISTKSSHNSEISVDGLNLSNNTVNRSPINKQIETRTLDGKRRITPMFIPPPPELKEMGMNNSSAPVTTFFANSSQSKSSIVIEKRDEIVPPNVKNAINSSLISTVCTPKKQTESVLKNGNSNNIKKDLSVKVTSNILLPPLKSSGSFSQLMKDFLVEIKSDEDFTHLQVFRNSNHEVVWDIYLGYTAIAIAVTPSILAVALEDGSLHILDTLKGCRLVPPLMPPSPLTKLCAVGSMVMSISCTGELRLWELEGTACKLVSSTTITHLITPGTRLLSCNLYNGIPMLAFSNARAYIFRTDMGTWMLVGDGQDPVWRWSAQSASSTILSRNPMGPLARIQETLNRTAGLPSIYPKFSHSAPCILNYLENQVLVCRSIKSSQEYKYWLMSYVQFLINHENLENKLRIVLDELLGPSHSTAKKSLWNPKILDFKKHSLLEDILNMLVGHIRWQRIYLEYKEQLDIIKETNSIE